jgi:glycosyltransferase involved in cell wall biosynthesis
MVQDLKLSICVIARNERDVIGRLAAQLANQTLFASPNRFEVVVVANGCTDDTASVAGTAFRAAFKRHPTTKLLIHDTPLGGKARSWNLAVHELLDAASDIAIFVDADIELVDDRVLEEVVTQLVETPSLLAVSGQPVKDIAKKSRKSLVDRFSLIVSEHSVTSHAINGSLYAARMAELRKIWLPIPTPGEDGLLSAMIHTDGFSRLPNIGLIAQVPRPTHYFEAHSITGFFRHETRMTVGTIINGWICEFLWSGVHSEHVGQFIRDQNERDPQWVGRLVESRVAGKNLVLPPRLLTWRLHNLRGVSFGSLLVRLPFSVAASLLGLWPGLRANRILKRQNAADYW